jgi:hypothetical protein
LQQTGTGAHDDLPPPGDIGHASRQKVRRRKMSSDYKSGMTYAAQAFANQFGEVGLSSYVCFLVGNWVGNFVVKNKKDVDVNLSP